MSPREIRLLKILSKGEKPSVYALRSKIGASNPADIKFRLTKRGWPIHTGYIDIIDRDGRLCKSGYYYIDSEVQRRALEYIEKIDEAVASASSKNNNLKHQSFNKINDNKWGKK